MTYARRQPSDFGENLCPPDLNFAPRSREAGDAPDMTRGVK